MASSYSVAPRENMSALSSPTPAGFCDDSSSGARYLRQTQNKRWPVSLLQTGSERRAGLCQAQGLRCRHWVCCCELRMINSPCNTLFLRRSLPSQPCPRRQGLSAPAWPPNNIIHASLANPFNAACTSTRSLAHRASPSDKPEDAYFEVARPKSPSLKTRLDAELAAAPGPAFGNRLRVRSRPLLPPAGSSMLALLAPLPAPVPVPLAAPLLPPLAACEKPPEHAAPAPTEDGCWAWKGEPGGGPWGLPK